MVHPGRQPKAVRLVFEREGLVRQDTKGLSAINFGRLDGETEGTLER